MYLLPLTKALSCFGTDSFLAFWAFAAPACDVSHHTQPCKNMLQQTQSLSLRKVTCCGYELVRTTDVSLVGEASQIYCGGEGGHSPLTTVPDAYARGHIYICRALTASIPGFVWTHIELLSDLHAGQSQ